MLRQILSLFRKPDYRESVYAHQDLSGQTRLAWYVRLRLMVSSRGIVDHAADQPVIWIRYRRVLLIALALWLAWLLMELVTAWNFFEG
jgi:hypothetical protein